MIDRLNFFDLYGYLLPGGFLLALLWLPFGLILRKWPPADWGSAALAVALAYICGHLLRTLAEAAFSSKFKDGPLRRYPSDLFLDLHDSAVMHTSLGSALKGRLQTQISEKFGANVHADAPQWTEEIGQDRNAAFFNCRGYLIAQKAAAYSEQQQGMYELLRGVAAALALASAYYLGLCLGFLARNWNMGGKPFASLCAVQIPFWTIVSLLGLGALIASFCSLHPKRSETSRRFVSYFVAALLVCAGMALAAVEHHGPLAGFDPSPNGSITLAMFVLAAAGLILAVESVEAFRRFAVNFARTVYQDFNMLVSVAPPPAQPQQQP